MSQLLCCSCCCTLRLRLAATPSCWLAAIGPIVAAALAAAAASTICCRCWLVCKPLCQLFPKTLLGPMVIIFVVVFTCCNKQGTHRGSSSKYVDGGDTAE
jgi:hypothetical protein